jgi:YesN/AraC family two-component response regulator
MTTISHPMPLISILLVEDEKVTLELLTTILAKKFSGAALHTAINGKAGLELFKLHMPDIVITDINMPEMSGVELADKIRAIKPDTRFIVITGDTGKLVLQDSVNKGFTFDHFIVKPVVFRELFASIEQCLGEIAQQNRG